MLPASLIHRQRIVGGFQAKGHSVISGIGVDVTSVERIEQSLARLGERFAKRILHPEEMHHYTASKQPARYLAKRFAAKEAACKALGTGIRDGVSFHDFVISNNAYGKPELRIEGRAAELCEADGVTTHHISISDEGDVVTAFAVFEQ